MSEEQAKKNYERAMRLEHEFKHYFTGNSRHFQPNCCIKSYRSFLVEHLLTWLEKHNAFFWKPSSSIQPILLNLISISANDIHIRSSEILNPPPPVLFGRGGLGRDYVISDFAMLMFDSGRDWGKNCFKVMHMKWTTHSNLIHIYP